MPVLPFAPDLGTAPVTVAPDALADLHQHALCSSTGGFYPVGLYGTWHGGLHLTAHPSDDRPVLASPIRMPSGGDVVAARLGGSDSPASTALGSTNFVLTRHRWHDAPYFMLFQHLELTDAGAMIRGEAGDDRTVPSWEFNPAWRKMSNHDASILCILTLITIFSLLTTGCVDNESDEESAPVQPHAVPVLEKKIDSRTTDENTEDLGGASEGTQQSVACSLNVSSPHSLTISTKVSRGDSLFLLVESVRQKNHVQNIPLPPFTGTLSVERVISCADINFDGWDDLGILQDRFMLNSMTKYWVYQDSLGRFTPIGVFPTLTVNPSNRTLESYQRHGHAGLAYSQTTYEWRTDSLIVSREVSQTIEANEPQRQIFRRTVKRRSEGVMTIVRVERLTVRSQNGVPSIDTTVVTGIQSGQ